MKTRTSISEADKAVRFFHEYLSHTKGRFAGHPFKLQPWQEDIVRPLFGEQAFDPQAKRWARRYRTCYVEVPRKNGKTQLGAGIACKLLFADGEPGAEIYFVAEDLDQANICFSAMRGMVEANPGLSERSKCYKRLIEHRNGSICRVIPGDAAGAHGLNIHGLIFDELHTQKDRELWDVMTSGQGARTQPLTVAFSTAGVFGASGICREQHDYGESIARGAHKDDSFRYVRYGMSEDPEAKEDWSDEAAWKLWNPALGHHLSLSFIRSEYVKAAESPARENTFRRLYGNEWTQQLTRWMPLRRWDAASGMVNEDALKGRKCYGGLDLASSVDVAALCWDFPIGEDTHQAIWRFFIPSEALPGFDKRTAGQAAVWAREGFLTITPGDVIDYRAIFEQISKDADAFEVADVGYDPWGMTQLAQMLDEYGMTVTAVRQGYATLSPPTKEWERLIYDGKYVHGGNPVMSWMIDNIVIRQDPAGNIKIDKAKSVEKVDGAVAAVMALSRALANDDRPSIYEQRGLTVF